MRLPPPACRRSICGGVGHHPVLLLEGLGAPVGSIVCGPADLISEIRYLRKRLGGGMRQAGVIAAAARVALAGRDRLTEDHALARELGDAIAERFPDALDPSLVETNMVRVHPLPLASNGWR